MGPETFSLLGRAGRHSPPARAALAGYSGLLGGWCRRHGAMAVRSDRHRVCGLLDALRGIDGHARGGVNRGGRTDPLAWPCRDCARHAFDGLLGAGPCCPPTDAGRELQRQRRGRPPAALQHSSPPAAGQPARHLSDRRIAAVCVRSLAGVPLAETAPTPSRVGHSTRTCYPSPFP